MITKTWPCKGSGGCGGTYSADLTAEAPADWTGDDWAAFMDAQSDHVAGHGSPGTLEGGRVTEMICDGGRLLWPARWNLWRHGTWKYTVTAIGPDGLPLPGAVVEIGPVEGGFSWAWYRPLGGRPAKLCIDGREYHRRQRARKKRRR